MENQGRLTDPLTTLPAEYWEADGPVYGALVDNVSVDGLLFFSIRDIPVGSKLNVRMFYANEYELDDIKAVSCVVRKNAHIAENWKGYRYALEFTHVSEPDVRKLMNLLNNNLELEKMSGMGSAALGNLSVDKTKSSPPLVDLDAPEESTSKCKFYKTGKCLKTNAFCDLCKNLDDPDLLEGRDAKSRRPNPFTAILSKLAENVRSAFQNQ